MPAPEPVLCTKRGHHNEKPTHRAGEWLPRHNQGKPTRGEPSPVKTTLSSLWASLVAQMVKNLPARQETWIQSLDQGDPLEKRMAMHSSILAWRIPQTEEPDGLQSVGYQRLGRN